MTWSKEERKEYFRKYYLKHRLPQDQRKKRSTGMSKEQKKVIKKEEYLRNRPKYLEYGIEYRKKFKHKRHKNRKYYLVLGTNVTDDVYYLVHQSAKKQKINISQWLRNLIDKAL